MAHKNQSNRTLVDDEDELPSYTALLLNSALYREYVLDGNYLYIKQMHNGPDIQFDAHCVYCEQMSTFKQYDGSSRGGGAGRSLPKDEVWLEPRVFGLEFRCQREPIHAYHYVFRVERQAITKIGQSPSLATIASTRTARFTGVVDKNYLRDLNRAIGLFAHGVGAGSFVYLRRIFEHLLFEVAATARGTGDLLNGFETMRMDEKIKALGSHLPAEVVETAGTYSILSAGIHGLSEEQCLSLFPIMRASVEIILDGHLAAREREKHKQELKRALAKAESQIKTDARAKKRN
jgi:hypothetical protein